MQFLAILLTIVSVCVANGSQQTESAYLDAQERFYIEWQYSDSNITILARVNTTGWFGIGFSPKGGMAGADIITAAVINGKATLQDRYAEQNGYPTIDASQDVQLLEGTQVNGVTTVKFTRKHDTCDDKDLIIGEDTIRVIYAISRDGSDYLSYHGAHNRGTKSIVLGRRPLPEPNIPDDAITMDITVENIEIPAFHTTYYCEVKRAPRLSTKHHIIKVEPIIEQENLGLVHHILLYGCYDSTSREHHFNNNTTGYECLNTANMPPDLQACKTTIVAWGVGGEAISYPEEAGFPLGADDSPDYMVMEMHYDNQQLVSGRRDNSGFRLIMTPTLRAHDVGIMIVGAVPGIAIPPKVKDFVSAGFCSDQCTQQHLTQDLKVFGSVLHAHLTSTQIIVRQFRNGTSLATIDQDRHYDFNYQQYKFLKQPVDITPGDDLMVQCHYNTEGRTNMTFGDLPSTSEMCEAHLFYYPASKLDQCYTMPVWMAYPYDGTSGFFRDQLDIEAISNPFDRFEAAFNEITEAKLWTKERVSKLEQAYFDYHQYELCMDRDYFKDPPIPRRYTPPAASKEPLPPRYAGQC